MRLTRKRMIGFITLKSLALAPIVVALGYGGLDPLIDPAAWHARLHFAVALFALWAMSIAQLEDDELNIAVKRQNPPPYAGAGLVCGFLVVVPAFAAVAYVSGVFLALDFNWLAAWDGAGRLALVDLLGVAAVVLAYGSAKHLAR